MQNTSCKTCVVTSLEPTGIRFPIPTQGFIKTLFCLFVHFRTVWTFSQFILIWLLSTFWLLSCNSWHFLTVCFFCVVVVNFWNVAVLRHTAVYDFKSSLFELSFFRTALLAYCSTLFSFIYFFILWFNVDFFMLKINNFCLINALC